MSEQKDLFVTKMNSLADSINAKAKTTGKKNLDELKTLVDGFSGGGGLPIEVEELPVKWSGTPVPNTGTVEKVYVNTNLTIDEVISLISQLTYTGGAPAVYVVYANENASQMIHISYVGGEDYFISYNGTPIVGNFRSDYVDEGIVGWKEDFNGVCELNDNAIIEIEGISIGTQNELLSSLFSTTPFVENEIVEGGIYKVEKESSYTPYINAGEDGIITFDEMFTLQGVPLTSYNVVDILPTENILTSDMQTTINIYYHKNNGLYLYGDVSGTGAYEWVDVCVILGFVYKGEVGSATEMTEIGGVYILNDGALSYHLYENNTFNIFLTYKDNKYINQVYEYGKVYKGSLTINSSSQSGGADYLMKFHEDCIEIITTTSGAESYWKLYNYKLFRYTNNELTKDNLNCNLYLKTANSIFIPLPLILSISGGYMTLGNFISLEFNLNGSICKIFGLISGNDGTYEGSLSLQADTTEWDTLIETLGVPEITEDTEVE